MAPSRMIPSALAGLLLAVVGVDAHGIASAIVKFPGGGPAGIYYQGYNPSYQYQNPQPIVVEWATPNDLINTFIGPSQYTDPDIVCHLAATNAGLAVPVSGGDILVTHWNEWPDSHKGPILDMLAPCNGPCETVDKTKLEFFEIGQAALLDSAKDFWAPNLLIQNNLTWAIQIPDSIAPGNYVLRHEIIALHAANNVGGAQNYPFCFNLAISSSGSDKPQGQRIQGLYKSTDPGIYFNLFERKGGSYPIPGPTLYSGAAKSVKQSGWTKVTATGTGVSTLDAALMTPKAGASSVASPATSAASPATSAATPAVTATAATPTAAAASAGKGSFTTVTVKTKVTVHKSVYTTMYTTVAAK